MEKLQVNDLELVCCLELSKNLVPDPCQNAVSPFRPLPAHGAA
jgi:hypothetical protein